jgi:serine O-acetyltransferase
MVDTKRDVTTPDRVRANSGVSAMILIVHRFGSWTLERSPRFKALLWPVYRAVDLLLVKLLVGADIPAGCKLGSSVILAHGGKGTVLSDEAIIGDRVTIYHQVTVGRYAKIGNDVWIGPGAKILENVTIGDSVKIGANAVVNHDVPDYSTAVGVPARVLGRLSSSH